MDVTEDFDDNGTNAFLKLLDAEKPSEEERKEGETEETKVSEDTEAETER
jgi:hypothetical protein